MDEGTLKTLQKLTRTKLIEETKNYPDITGAHGMSKEELVEALTEVKKTAGEWVEAVEEEVKKAVKKTKKAVPDKAALKKQIKKLKKQREEALASGDGKSLAQARAGINRLKGHLRRMKVSD
jgi:glutamate mutase epsilon subunit